MPAWKAGSLGPTQNSVRKLHGLPEIWPGSPIHHEAAFGGCFSADIPSPILRPSREPEGSMRDHLCILIVQELPEDAVQAALAQDAMFRVQHVSRLGAAL